MPRQRINNKTCKREWYGRAEVQGRSRERRAEPNTKREAILLDEVLRQELSEEIARKACPDQIELLEDLRREYIRELIVRKMCKNSLNAKELAFRRLFENVKPTTKIGELSRMALNKHAQKVAVSVSLNTANVDVRHLKAAYNWAIGNDMIKCLNPCAKIKPFRVDKRERHVPTLEEFQKALNVCETSQDRLMLLTYFETGARLREILGLKWSDVDLANGSLRLWTGKRRGGREADWVGVSANLVDILREQQLETRFKEFVFISPKTGTKFYNRPKFFAGLAKRAGIERFTAHEIRHLTATLMLHGGESVAAIQKVLRHTNPMTTTLYLHGFKGVAQSSIIANASAELFGNNHAERQAEAHLV